mgnify:CR=1 FL=1
MATNTTSTSTLAPEIQTYYDKKLIDRLLPNLEYAKFAQKRPMPLNGGKTVQFRKFAALTPVSAALTEGVTPAGSAITVTEIRATPQQYGDFVEISDVLDMVALDPVLDEMSTVLAEQAAQTIDQRMADVIAAGTVVQYTGGKTSRATLTAADVITIDDVRKAVRTLKRNNAKPIDGRNYVGIIEPGGAFDLQSDSKWEEAALYAGSTQLFDGEVGRVYGVRFIESSFAKKFAGAGASGADVLATMIIGKDSYGCVDVGGSGNVKMIVKQLGSGGSTDPLDQRATAGWKALFTAVILEQLAMVRIESGVSG